MREAACLAVFYAPIVQALSFCPEPLRGRVAFDAGNAQKRFALRLRGEVGEYRRFCGWLGGNVVFRGVCGGIPVELSLCAGGPDETTSPMCRRERRGSVYLLCPLSGIPFGAKNAPFVRTCMVACRYGQMGRRFGFPRGFICFVQQNGVCHDLPPGFSSSRSSFLPRQKAYAISISIAAAKNSREEARLARTESISSRR